MSALNRLIRGALNRMEARGEYRALHPAIPRGHARIARDGTELLDFSSNDYLGLSQHSLLKERAAEWAEQYGAGAGSSRLVCGTMPQHLAVEAKLASFKGSEAALIFPSGWQANSTVLPAILRLAGDSLLFTDRLIHASLHHGCAAAGARQIRFRHNDLDHLAALLEARQGETGVRVIVTESIFSMDGDGPDLLRLAELARAHEAILIVDEAHATGVAGPRGAGLVADVAGVDIVIGTFSKAFGAFGAYVAGSELLRDYLINACGGFIFSTAPPPAILGAIDAALDIVPTMDAERAHLAALGRHVRERLAAAGFDTAGSTSQIVPVVVGHPGETIALSRRLESAGILAAAIRPPSVPPGSSRLRLALRSTHSAADIDRLLSCLTSQAPKAA